MSRTPTAMCDTACDGSWRGHYCGARSTSVAGTPAAVPPTRADGSAPGGGRRPSRRARCRGARAPPGAGTRPGRTGRRDTAGSGSARRATRRAATAPRTPSPDCGVHVVLRLRARRRRARRAGTSRPGRRTRRVRVRRRGRCSPTTRRADSPGRGTIAATRTISSTGTCSHTSGATNPASDCATSTTSRRSPIGRRPTTSAYSANPAVSSVDREVDGDDVVTCRPRGPAPRGASTTSRNPRRAGARTSPWRDRRLSPRAAGAGGTPRRSGRRRWRGARTACPPPPSAPHRRATRPRTARGRMSATPKYTLHPAGTPSGRKPLASMTPAYCSSPTSTVV